VSLEILALKNWFPQFKDKPLIISGPCSAETEEQLNQTVDAISKTNKVDVIRAGVWKSRTRPGTFQGVGKEALKWLKSMKERTGLLATTEVITPEDVEECLKFGIDILWVGARTTSNPVYTQKIADALKGVDVPVMIKNPIHPELDLWIGTLERFNKVGLKRLAAIHRGFHPFEKARFRNVPRWEIPIELKRRFPDLPIICDPSHIAGKREFVQEISQKALFLNMDGLMVESHINPKEALSDAKQQLNPGELLAMLENLSISRPESDHENGKLAELRTIIDELDDKLIETLSERFKIVDEIAKVKCERNLSIFQLRRWEETLAKSMNSGHKIGLNEDFIKNILSIIHIESIQYQNEVIKKLKCDGE
jgi:chorismate mutase